eukprot:CAMPEP_0119318736 /NCGR_PEP_ID=MMETSP1333-20130426/47460_1 /TAXON_ID=418940 /ORGANISM="Scyphosphaera apsteinii, Strain RCC1455" /LENGTH=218 /DNA_ID=CAMNT_0007324995 /DNA_START=834 /DNA_END=1488 /DNA_ORIENTATION=+
MIGCALATPTHELHWDWLSVQDAESAGAGAACCAAATFPSSPPVTPLGAVTFTLLLSVAVGIDSCSTATRSEETFSAAPRSAAARRCARCAAAPALSTRSFPTLSSVLSAAATRSQLWQHETLMNLWFFLHSPLAAHEAQSRCLSAHESASDCRAASTADISAAAFSASAFFIASFCAAFSATALSAAALSTATLSAATLSAATFSAATSAAAFSAAA